MEELKAEVRTIIDVTVKVMGKDVKASLVFDSDGDLTDTFQSDVEFFDMEKVNIRLKALEEKCNRPVEAPPVCCGPIGCNTDANDCVSVTWNVCQAAPEGYTCTLEETETDTLKIVTRKELIDGTWYLFADEFGQLHTGYWLASPNCFSRVRGSTVLPIWMREVLEIYEVPEILKK